jgi:hypothetical protein
MSSRSEKMRVHKDFKKQAERLAKNVGKKYNVKVSNVEISKFSADILKQIDSETFVMRRKKKRGYF